MGMIGISYSANTGAALCRRGTGGPNGRAIRDPGKAENPEGGVDESPEGATLP